MNRRDALQMFAAGSALAARPSAALAQATRGLPPLKITDVRTILTQSAVRRIASARWLSPLRSTST
jgi:hypothetical protein